MAQRMFSSKWALQEFFRIERHGDKEVLVGLADGKLPKGSRVRKVDSLPGDTHQDGALATVVGALGPANHQIKAELRRRGLKEVEWIYWVEWDDLPGMPVGITENRIEAIG